MNKFENFELLVCSVMSCYFVSKEIKLRKLERFLSVKYNYCFCLYMYKYLFSVVSISKMDSCVSPLNFYILPTQTAEISVAITYSLLVFHPPCTISSLYRYVVYHFSLPFFLRTKYVVDLVIPPDIGYGIFIYQDVFIYQKC